MADPPRSFKLKLRSKRPVRGCSANGVMLIELNLIDVHDLCEFDYLRVFEFSSSGRSDPATSFRYPRVVKFNRGLQLSGERFEKAFIDQRASF